MFWLYAVEIIDADTGEVICEQLVEAISPNDAQVRAMQLHSHQHCWAGHAYIEE